MTGGEIAFQARGVAIEYPENVDTEIDALLTFVPAQGDVATPMLRGDVRVLRGAYRGTVSLPALVAFNRAPAPPADTSDYLDAMRLDIAVSTEEDLVVDNNYGRFEAGASLRLAGTVEPAGRDRPRRPARGRRDLPARRPLPPQRQQHLVHQPVGDRAGSRPSRCPPARAAPRRR